MNGNITVNIKYLAKKVDVRKGAELLSMENAVKQAILNACKSSELEGCIVIDHSLSPTISEAIEEVTNELFRAIEKFPSWPTEKNGGGNYVKAAAIISEESGELIRAALKYEDESGTIEMMREEAIQTAAMALRFLINLPEQDGSRRKSD